MRRRRLWNLLCEEQGSSIIEDLLALMILGLVFAVGVQVFAYAQARSVAIAAAQDGARTAASNGDTAGIARAQEVLDAGSGAARHLTQSVTDDPDTVTVTIQGAAPSLLPVPMLIPAIRTSATEPLEQYAPDEQAVSP